MTFLNVDGPDLRVRAGVSPARELACGRQLTLDPEDSDLPALPWTVELLRMDGTTFGTVTYDGASPDRFVTVRGESIFVGPTLGVGPAPATSACAT